ncbi:CDP-alcohol phosphatidyltransferase family protein [candidate division KSB1 bacterium]|nr:CDP-alcohol phosphatidyltransferase family protein [candidate division KSB1 bacterium]
MIKEFIEMPGLERWIGKNFKFISPNGWTTISLIIAIAAFYAVVEGQILLGAGLFIFGGFLDVIDGKVARFMGKSSKLGAFWDGTVDRFVDMLMILSLFYLEFTDPILPMELLLFFLLFFTLLPPFIVAYANHRGAVPDPTEKVIWRFAFRIEYVVLFIAALIVYLMSPLISLYLVYASLILMVATTVQSIIMVFIKSKDYTQ